MMTPDIVPNSEDILEEAIGWAMVSSEGFADDAERAAFNSWLTSDARHRTVWQKLNHDLASFRSLGRSVSGSAMVAALDRPQTDRRSALRAIGAAGLGLSGLAMFGGFDVPLALAADMHTATGERRRFDLADSTALTLDARSRVDLAFDDIRRGIVLHEGTVLATVQSGATPFHVRAGPMRVAITSGDFVISHRRGPSRVVSAGGSGQLTLAADTRMVGPANEGYAVIDDMLASLPRSATMDATSWLTGNLILHDRSLQDLVDAMRPYQSGMLSISDAAAALRISGVFDLSDLPGTLAMIQSAQPLRTLRLGNLLCHICLIG